MSAPASLCDAPALHATVLALVPEGRLRCGDPMLDASYLRVGVRGHDLVLVQVVDALPTTLDGPVEHRTWLVVDGALACDAMPCGALDATGADATVDDARLLTLLSMALGFEPGSLLRSTAEVDRQLALWADQAELLRAHPVGLERRGAEVSLRALAARDDSGMSGSRRTLELRTATLAGGRVRITSQRLLDDFAPHVPAQELAAPREDERDGLEGLEL